MFVRHLFRRVLISFSISWFSTPQLVNPFLISMVCRIKCGRGGRSDLTNRGIVEFWQANATGIYSGVIAGGNNGGAENINATFQRGIQPTDSEGVTQFTAYYPGHYTGRTEHIHVATHLNGSYVLPPFMITGSPPTFPNTNSTKQCPPQQHLCRNNHLPRRPNLLRHLAHCSCRAQSHLRRQPAARHYQCARWHFLPGGRDGA